MAGLLEFPAVVSDGVAFVGNYWGSIRAVAMGDGALVWRHDVRRGKMASSPAVYEPDALAFEKPSAESAEEFRRKVRMLPWNWAFLLKGRPLRGVPPLYAAELLSHRHLRYGSGLLHVLLLGTNLALVGQGLVYQVALAAQALWLALAALGRLRAPVPGAALAYYYFLMMTATIASLFRYLRSGPALMWEKAEGTR